MVTIFIYHVTRPTAVDTVPRMSKLAQTTSLQLKSSNAFLVPTIKSAPEKPLFTITPTFSASSSIETAKNIITKTSHFGTKHKMVLWK